jgi:LmbE family N-acetylglucosaminyl deacetylase
MNPYLKFVQEIEAGVEKAKEVSVDATPSSRTGSDEGVASTILMVSPHPDDECLIGLLTLRLQREMGKQIINVPVTFGSKVERQSGRAKELEEACSYLGWTIHQEYENFQALEVADVARILEKYQPETIVMPHAKDWNSRHIATHFLVVEALEKMPPDFCCTVVETEFWGAMDDPNLMVEADAELVAELVAATSLHVEEVARNPYHLLLPAWMQDNVRRGGELVGGQGGAVPDFSFATLYRFRKWQDGAWVDVLEKGATLPMGAENLKELF